MQCTILLSTRSYRFSGTSSSAGQLSGPEHPSYTSKVHRSQHCVVGKSSLRQRLFPFTMKSSTSTVLIEPSISSGRRQPIRQTRTNPARSTANPVRPSDGRGSIGGPQEDVNATNSAPGFFPAITHFTDSITALSNEMIRHSSMLREVDATIFRSEAMVEQLVAAARSTPNPPRKTATISYNTSDLRSHPHLPGLSAGPLVDLENRAPEDNSSSPKSQADETQFEFSRRKLFYNLRMGVGEMLTNVDEKNHVLNTANDGLDRLLSRCGSSYIYVEDEISEEARLGSRTHWAYTSKATEKKGTTAGERTRRDAAAVNGLAGVAAAMHEGDVTLRSEARREAIAARKHRNHHIDSDFDDTRTATQSHAKKPSGLGKGRKVSDIHLSNGLSITNGAGAVPAGSSKRRKVEKPATTLIGLGLEPSMSTVFGNTVTNGRGRAASPGEAPALEGTRKRARNTGVANGTTRKRYGSSNIVLISRSHVLGCRAATNVSNMDSPLMASSPVTGNFPIAKDLHRKSPAPGSSRAQPPRGRQNSMQSLLPDARNRASPPVSSRYTNGNGASNDATKIAAPTGRSVGETQNPTRDAGKSKGEQLAGDADNGDGEPLGGVLGHSRSTDRSMKREESQNGVGSRVRSDRPPSISVSVKGGGKISKTVTPVSGSFTESQRSRPTRASEPALKRSHKKGAGLAAQLAAAAAADEDGSSIQGDEEEDEDGTEPRYCYCNQISYGEMVACDSGDCSREWFHLDCAGLVKAPTKGMHWSLCTVDIEADTMYSEMVL